MEQINPSAVLPAQADAIFQHFDSTPAAPPVNQLVKLSRPVCRITLVQAHVQIQQVVISFDKLNPVAGTSLGTLNNDGSLNGFNMIGAAGTVIYKMSYKLKKPVTQFYISWSIGGANNGFMLMYDGIDDVKVLC